MRYQFNLLPLLLLLGTSYGITAQEAEKTLVKSFNLEGQTEVLIDLKGDVEVQKWKSDVLRIQMTIAIPGGSDAMLKSLVKARRYNLEAQKEELLKIIAPGLERVLFLGGKPLEETISYLIYAPENVTVKLGEDASTAVEPADKASTL